MKSIFLIEGSSNFAEQIFVVVQYFVSFAELICMISGQNRKNYFCENFCPEGTVDIS